MVRNISNISGERLYGVSWKGESDQSESSLGKGDILANWAQRSK